MATNLPEDEQFLESLEQIQQHVRTIFSNRGLDVDDTRVLRIAKEIQSGERGFVDLRIDLRPFAKKNADVGIPDESGGEGSDGDMTVREYMEAHFPSFVWALDHPEIGPILEQAAEEEWDQLRIQGALQGTTWWKTTSTTARQAKLLQENDPAEWQRQVQAKQAEIDSMAKSLGLTLKTGQSKKIAAQTLTMGFNPQQLEQAIIANSNFNKLRLEDIESGKVGGVLATIEEQVDQIADDWMLNIPDATRMEWIRKIALGEKTPDAFLNYAQTMARKQMPFLADLLDSGVTPREALQPYQQAVGEVLERPYTSVDFSDRRYRKVLMGEGGTMTTIPEAKALTREVFHREWNHTEGARQTATKTVQMIAETFGRRA